MSKNALILGVGGQDGSYMADLLVQKGYRVVGLHRRSSYDNLGRVRHLQDKVEFIEGDLTDAGSILNAFNLARPDEVYNLADQDHVGSSFFAPLVSVQVTYGGVAWILEVIRSASRGGKVRFFQPVSATMYAEPDPNAPEQTLHERSEIAPDSPYACAKTAVAFLCNHYRNKHGVDVRLGIMFNHDSERRGQGYLLQKIRQLVARIRDDQDGNVTEIFGNPCTKVDIGYAPEYMEAAWRILQLKPDRDDAADYVVATGRPHRVGDLIALAFDYLGRYEDSEQISASMQDRSSPPARIGNPAKLKDATGWQYTLDAKGVLLRLLAHDLAKREARHAAGA